MSFDPSDKLIPARKALKIIDWLTYSGLYASYGGTHVLTKYRIGYQTRYSKMECERLRELHYAAKNRQPEPESPCPEELI